MRALALKAMGQPEPETPRNNQGPKISFETSTMISSKLKEKLAKTRRGVATKKLFEKQQEKQPVPSTIFPTLVSIDNLNDKYHHQPGDGFSEKIYENDQTQQRAREGIRLLRKNMKEISVHTTTIIKKMNAQSNYLSVDINSPHANENKDEKLNLKVSDPNSVLHIANYMQNKEFNQLTELAIVDFDQILKINAKDGLTFFRLHHELDEISRKKENFEKMKGKYFDNRDSKELIKYDKELDRFDEATHQQKAKAQAVSNKNMSEKDKELINTAVLKITIKKDNLGKNLVRDFFNGITDAKEQNRRNEEERRGFH